MVPIGQMRSVVKFEKNTPVDTDSGGQIDSYTELLTTYGHLKKKGGGRSQEEGDVFLNSTYELTCRFQTALDNQLNTSVRAVINNKFFTIHSFEQIDEKRFYYKFILKEQAR